MDIGVKTCIVIEPKLTLPLVVLIHKNDSVEEKLYVQRTCQINHPATDDISEMGHNVQIMYVKKEDDNFCLMKDKLHLYTASITF